MASTDGGTEGGTAVRLGYWLSSEEHHPHQLVEHAVAAEEAGFTTAMISDHLNPWTEQQGHSAFVWGVLGAIGEATDELTVGTGVSAIVHRIHPVVLAHAAATASVLMPGRFFLGVGTGERLNEQVTGQRWPRPGERRKMLEDALTPDSAPAVMRWPTTTRPRRSSTGCAGSTRPRIGSASSPPATGPSTRSAAARTRHEDCYGPAVWAGCPAVRRRSFISAS